MTEAKAEKRSFFKIYKPGQGKWVRWGTVAGMALVSVSGAYWLAGIELADVRSDIKALVQAVVGAVWMILWAWLTFWLVNSPKYGEFMIMTESEMRKVSWPSRREVINSTKVVILLTVILGLLLFLVDVGFVKLFQWMGIS